MQRRDVGQKCLVACLLQVQFHHAMPFFPIIPMHSVSFHCRLDWYHLADHRVDAESAESRASRFGQHLVDTLAGVIRVALADTPDRQCPTAFHTGCR